MLEVLADGGLPRKWWGEAALTVTFVANCSPARGDMATPHEHFFGTKPEMEHLCAFGCGAWVHVPRHVRRKMGNKSQQGAFLRYCENTMGVKILLNDKIALSRDFRLH